MRVTDEMVSRWLVWARNFEEILSYAVGSGRGRRFTVRVRPGITRDGRELEPVRDLWTLMGHKPEDVVPEEMVFTAREAMAFAYGCAVGGAARARGDWTQEDWERQSAERDRQYKQWREEELARREAAKKEKEGTQCLTSQSGT